MPRRNCSPRLVVAMHIERRQHEGANGQGEYRARKIERNGIERGNAGHDDRRRRGRCSEPRYLC
ncbi:hypothetical protein ACX0FC_20210, partial [Enterococcus faecium]